MHGKGALTHASGFADQGEVLIKARKAGVTLPRSATVIITKDGGGVIGT